MDNELSPFFALEKGLDFHRVATNMMERFGEVRMSDNLNKEPIGDYLAGERLKFKPNQRKAFDIQYATSFRKAINITTQFNLITSEMERAKSQEQNVVFNEQILQEIDKLENYQTDLDYQLGMVTEKLTKLHGESSSSSTFLILSFI